jgi:hypothetical protein
MKIYLFLDVPSFFFFGIFMDSIDATRIRKIRISSAGPYEDVGGPVCLTITLMVAISLNFLWKLKEFF